MKLPPFRMHRPSSVEEAVELRRELGDEAAFYCGGTELLLVMKLGLTDLRHLIDIKGIEALRAITFADGSLRIGATATHREIERDPLVQQYVPAMVPMVRAIANIRVRSVGTIGGNLAFADPASDPATFLAAVGAVVETRGPGGSSRVLPIADLTVGAYQTALDEDELIEAVVVPPVRSREATVHQRMKFKERPAITVTVSAVAEGDVIIDARVAVGALAPVPARIGSAERLLHGLNPSTMAAAADQAGEAAAAGIRLMEESEQDQLYKKQLTRVLVARAATEAMERALAM